MAVLPRISLCIRTLGRRGGRVLWVAAAAAVLIVLGLAVGRPASSGAAGVDHMGDRQKWMAGRLRAALRENMEEFMGKDAKATFLPKGEVPRLTDIDAVEFLDYMKSSQPFVLSNPGKFPCTRNKWDLGFIEREAGDDVVGIETSKSNRFYSNEGLKKARMTVREFLQTFRSPDRKVDLYLAEESVAQFPKLEADVQELGFASAGSLDKTQVWIGAGGQVSPLHHDQWENLLCQLAGTRVVTLYDPLQTDRLYPKAGINRHFSQVDPEHPDYAKFPRFVDAKGHRVKLSAGDILFVPAMWWHQVHHEAAVNVAVNFWYLPSLLSELLMDVLLPDGPNY
eukprot:TRINITY_DN14291_c0_g1_i1.p1 TRINITY_DN14291_c0_g1~~TRINITY_DN14291_c0_g1_i1.p1  ORF type:complete len:357 (+),score=134.74 TRINITY_DN14291_c0_g1_i1:58-1071(+)